MPERFLGIDTSNYRTSAAIYNAETGEWVNRGGLLTVPEGVIGLRQSDALFQHTVRLHEKIEALPQGEVRAIGVSTRPRAVEGSYMPCFLAGESVARSAAHLLSVPLFTVSHQQGHIAAAALSAGKLDLLDGEFLAWHLSGGTSELLHVKCGADGLPDCTCIGGHDRPCSRSAARSRGEICLVCRSVRRRAGRAGAHCRAGKGVQAKVNECKFSLSGMQNQVENKFKTAEPKQMARLRWRPWRMPLSKRPTEQAREQYHCPILCAGGVMASQIIRARMNKRFGGEVSFGANALWR